MLSQYSFLALGNYEKYVSEYLNFHIAIENIRTLEVEFDILEIELNEIQ